MNEEESLGDSVVENEDEINQDENDTSESFVENQADISNDADETHEEPNDELQRNEEQENHEDVVYDHDDDLQQENVETIEDSVEIEPEEQEFDNEDDQHVSVDHEVYTTQEEIENDQHEYVDLQEVVEHADEYEEQHQEEKVEEEEYVEAEVEQHVDTDLNIIDDKERAQRDVDNQESNLAAGKIDESEEDDFDNVVEVDEDKPESDNEDENVAQHDSDSESEDEPKTEEIKLGDVSDDDLRGASSGSENEASEDDNLSVPKKKSAIASSDDEEEPRQESKEGPHHQEAVLKMFDSDSEDEHKEEGVGDLIADIFGESDDEEEEFTGFGQEEISNKDGKKSTPIYESEDEGSERESDDEQDTATQAKPVKPVTKEESDSDEENGDRGLSDFDLMMKRKKEEYRRHRRRRDGGTCISDADDIINAMLTKMKEAAEGDRDANLKRKPALEKLKMLKSVIMHLRKQDLKESFVDNGVIAAIADWLSLLPDRSLPHITIRTELLQILHDLPAVSAETLKHSGIGKAVMILFKHPKEIRKNKESAGRLINKWSRPIFGLNENFKSMTREEREQRDLDQMPQAKRRRLSSGAHAQTEEGREGELGQLRPGEQGFVMRARVPMPSTKDYVVRPKWNVESTMFGEEEEEWPKKHRRSAGAPRSSKKDERLEKHIRNFAERRKNSKMQRAVNISIEGNKMKI